jgi:hypothetical protein
VRKEPPRRSPSTEWCRETAVHGRGTLIRCLLENDLVDEMNLQYATD